MHYHRFKVEDTFIEFHNNWLGVETVIINGQIVSKKSSIAGISHQFTVLENGHTNHYVLTTKLDSTGFGVLIDLRQNGKLIQENVPIGHGTKPRRIKNKSKISGVNKIKAFEIEAGMADLIDSLKVDAEDPEIYFYLACGYSIQENALEGFEALKNAVAYKLQNLETILDHEMLAYLRMQEAFEGFIDSNFTEYDPDKLKSKE